TPAAASHVAGSPARTTAAAARPSETGLRAARCRTRPRSRSRRMGVGGAAMLLRLGETKTPPGRRTGRWRGGFGRAGPEASDLDVPHRLGLLLFLLGGGCAGGEHAHLRLHL